MAILVRIPTPLRPLAKNQSEVQSGVGAKGATVKDVLEDLARTYPELASKVTDPDGKLRRYVNFFVNETDVRDLQGASTPMKDGDVLSIMPAIAGGR